MLTLHSTRLHLAVKMADEYSHYRQLPPALLAQQGPVGPTRPQNTQKLLTAGRTSPRVRPAPTLTPPSIDRHLPRDRYYRQYT